MSITDDFVRVNIKLPKETKEWCQAEGRKYGATMSQMLAFIIVNYHEQKDATRAMKQLETASKGISIGTMMQEFREIADRFNGMYEAMEQFEQH